MKHCLQSITTRLAVAVCLCGVIPPAMSGCSDGSSTSTESGVVTVGGADADGNGVRDDIDAYIDQTYTDTGSRTALRQYGRAVQAAILDAGHAGLSGVHAIERFRAIECIMARRPNDFPVVFTELRSRMLDTDARTKAYLQADGHVRANTPSLLPADQWLSACASS